MAKQNENIKVNDQENKNTRKKKEGKIGNQEVVSIQNDDEITKLDNNNEQGIGAFNAKESSDHENEIDNERVLSTDEYYQILANSNIPNSDNEQKIFISDINKENNLNFTKADYISTKIFNSTNLLIKDSFETVEEADKKQIKLGLVSERQFDSVLSNRSNIRYGATSITFINLFDKVLIRSIAENSTRIGSVLSNKIFIRQIAYKVLDEVIRESSHNRNRGYVRRSFQITRSHISNSISRLLKKTISKSRDPMRQEFIDGLAGIIEITMIAQLVNYYLFEIDDLNEKIITSIHDSLCAVNDYQSFQHVIMTYNIRNSIRRILGSTAKLSNTVSDDDQLKSVDNSVIVNSFMKEIALISEVLINNDISSKDIDNVMTLFRIYRDKDILNTDDDLKLLIKEVDNMLKKNADTVQFFLSNYDINEFLDEIPIEKIYDFKVEFSGQLNSLNFYFFDTIRLMKDTLSDEDSFIHIQSKEDFLQEFTIRNTKNKIGMVYHSFVRRNFRNSSNNQVFDALVQRLRPSRDLLKSVPVDTDVIMTLNDRRGSGDQFSQLLEDIFYRSVLASEYSFFSCVDNIMPDLIDGMLCQTALLKSGDIRKIAALNSDQVIVMYLEYMEPFIRKIQSKIDLDIDSINTILKSKSHIYVKIGSYNQRHKDSSKDSLGKSTIITKEPRRIISTIDSYEGKNGVNIISNMVKKGKYVIGSLYMSEAFKNDFTIWPNSKSVNLKIALPDRFKSVDGFNIHVDFRKLLQPFSMYSMSIGSRNVYHDICNEYTKILSFFRSQILSVMSNFKIEFDRLRRGFDIPDYKIVKNQEFKNDNCLKNGTNTAFFEQCIISSSDAVLIAKPIVHSFEEGSTIQYDRPTGIRFTVSVPEEIFMDHSSLIGHTYCSVIKNRMDSDASLSHQFFLMHLSNELYKNNNFFSQMVDNILQYNGDFDGSDKLYASKLLELYSFETSSENPSVFRMIASISLFLLLKTLSRKGGDLNFIFGSKNADLLLNLILNDKTDVDTSVALESSFILTRKNVRLNDFVDTVRSKIKIFNEASFFESDRKDHEYKTQLLSNLMESHKFDITEKVSDIVEESSQGEIDG